MGDSDPDPIIAATASPFDALIGLEILEVTRDRVTGRLELDPTRHAQPFGITHGGVYATMVETLASLGASANVLPERTAAGIENQTSFLRSIATGTVTGVGTPIQRGRQMHLWMVEIGDQQGRLLAHGRVRLVIREISAPA